MENFIELETKIISTMHNAFEILHHTAFILFLKYYKCNKN